MVVAGTLFPAPAGMIPLGTLIVAEALSFPRTRGDDPITKIVFQEGIYFSPHPRG